jgi:hypothetical protein
MGLLKRRIIEAMEPKEEEPVGYMKNLLITVYNGGQDALDAVTPLLKAASVGEWIPVEERLPPLMTEVLGWHKDDCVRAWFRHSGQPKDAPYWESWSPQDRECDDCDVDEPSHWMPLPEPPEVK